MMRLAQREAFGFKSGVLLDLDVLGPLGLSSMAMRVRLGEGVFRIVKLLDINIRNTRVVYRVTPTQIFVVAEYRKRHTQERGAGNIPALIAMQVSFVELSRAEEEDVRVDEEHGVTARAFLRA